MSIFVRVWNDHPCFYFYGAVNNLHPVLGGCLVFEYHNGRCLLPTVLFSNACSCSLLACCFRKKYRYFVAPIWLLRLRDVVPPRTKWYRWSWVNKLSRHKQSQIHVRSLTLCSRNICDHNSNRKHAASHDLWNILENNVELTKQTQNLTCCLATIISKNSHDSKISPVWATYALSWWRIQQTIQSCIKCLLLRVTI